MVRTGGSRHTGLAAPPHRNIHYKNVGKRILSERLLHNYTREYLAELADISPKFLYEIETGKKGCSSFVLYRLATALNIKTGFIMFDEKEISSSNDFNEVLDLFNNNQIDILIELLKLIYKLSKK